MCYLPFLVGIGFMPLGGIPLGMDFGGIPLGGMLFGMDFMFFMVHLFGGMCRDYPPGADWRV